MEDDPWRLHLSDHLLINKYILSPMSGTVFRKNMDTAKERRYATGPELNRITVERVSNATKK